MAGENVPFFRVTLGPSGPKVKGEYNQSLGQTTLPESLQTGNDIFAEWRWDGNQVIVRNCRFGFFPVFYYATENEFGVAPSVEQLLELGAPSDLDDAALATFLRLGFHLGEDTVFRAIRAVPPGGEVRWNGGDAKVTGGYMFPQGQNLSRNTAIDGYGELFRQAVRRRASRKVSFGFPLSGGRDSRHILLELNALGCLPEACFTTHDYPPYRVENIRIAGLLAERLGITQYVIGQPGSRVTEETRKNRITSYGAMEHAWGMGFYRNLAKHTSIVYDGLAGDALSADTFLNRDHVALFEQNRIEELAEQLLERWLDRPGYEDALSRVLTIEATRRFTREMALERVVKELNRHTSAVIPLSSFHFWNRTRRGTASIPFSILPAAGLKAVTPYLDHDLFEFLASFPADMYMDKTFHTDTIRRMYPEFNDVPYAGGKNTPLIENNWHYRRLFTGISSYLAVNGRSWLVRKGPTIRRLLALAASREGNLRMRMSWIAPFTVLYMTQLEKVCSQYQKVK